MRKRYKNILAAYDGSPMSKQALYEAAEAAKRNEARLYIVQIINDAGLMVNSAVPSSKIIDEEMREAKALLEEVAKEIDYMNIETTVVVGNPKQAISYAFPEARDIDLIYVGATGKGAVERLLIGSTASYVVNHAPCNVMVVK